MTYEEALVKVRGYLTSYLPLNDEGEIDEIMQALDQKSVLNEKKEEIRDNTYFINEITEKEGIDFKTVEEIIDKYIERKDIAIKALEQLPSDDSVFKNLWAQVKWERDVAIEQLEQLGYSLGEKIRTSEDCISRKEAINEMSNAIKRVFAEHRDIAEKAMNKLPSVTPSYNLIKTELKSSEDCISKKIVLDMLEDINAETEGVGFYYEHYVDYIKDLPSVTPSNDAIKEAYIKGYDYGVKDWFKSNAESCEDCISRAKALEMLGDVPENWTDTEKEIQEVNDYRWFKSILEELPSVTPSYNSIKTELKPCEDAISRNDLKRAISEMTYWHPTTDGRLEVGGAFDNTVYKVEDVWRLTKILLSVKPQPFINKPCISEGVCHEDKVNVLKKIRAEIEAKIVRRPWLDFEDKERDRNDAFLEVLEIIDKYKSESEDME